jgi:hypothetical protein
MFTVLLVLTVAAGVDLVAGFVWLLASRGQTRRRSGPAVGAEVFGQIAEAEEDFEQEPGQVSVPLAERSVFRGTGVKLEREAAMGYDEIKAALRARRWRQALPGLSILSGMTGLLAFGSLTLWVSWEDKLIGGVLVAVVFYALIRIWIGFARA